MFTFVAALPLPNSNPCHCCVGCWPGARPGSEVWNSLYFTVREFPFTTCQLVDDDCEVDFNTVTSPSVSNKGERYSRDVVPCSCWRGDFCVLFDSCPVVLSLRRSFYMHGLALSCNFLCHFLGGKLSCDKSRNILPLYSLSLRHERYRMGHNA